MISVLSKRVTGEYSDYFHPMCKFRFLLLNSCLYFKKLFMCRYNIMEYLSGNSTFVLKIYKYKHWQISIKFYILIYELIYKKKKNFVRKIWNDLFKPTIHHHFIFETSTKISFFLYRNIYIFMNTSNNLKFNWNFTAKYKKYDLNRKLKTKMKVKYFVVKSYSFLHNVYFCIVKEKKLHWKIMFLKDFHLFNYINAFMVLKLFLMLCRYL